MYTAQLYFSFSKSHGVQYIILNWHDKIKEMKDNEFHFNDIIERTFVFISNYGFRLYTCKMIGIRSFSFTYHTFTQISTVSIQTPFQACAICDITSSIHTPGAALLLTIHSISVANTCYKKKRKLLLPFTGYS